MTYQQKLSVLPRTTSAGSAIIRTLYQPLTDRIAINVQEGLFIFRFKDILYCEAMSNYCRIHTTDGKSVLTSKTLKQIVEHLPDYRFIRIHQSYAVNLEAITQVVGTQLSLDRAVKLPISRARRKEVLQTIKSRLIQA